MKKCLFLFLILSMLFISGCESFDLQEMTFTNSRSLSSEEVNVDDLLVTGSPQEFRDATGRILRTSMGKKMLQAIKLKNPNGPFIRFYPILDSNGHLVMTSMEMGYAANGMIYYTGAVLESKYNDELLFHEFFHIYQYGKIVAIKKSRNAELEAYLAQYIYTDGKNGSGNAPLLNRMFTLIIGKLASYIDKNTGDFKTSVDIDEFCKLYNEALNYLEVHPKYFGSDWSSVPINRYSKPFPNLIKLLNS